MSMYLSCSFAKPTNFFTSFPSRTSHLVPCMKKYYSYLACGKSKHVATLVTLNLICKVRAKSRSHKIEVEEDRTLC